MVASNQIKDLAAQLYHGTRHNTARDATNPGQIGMAGGGLGQDRGGSKIARPQSLYTTLPRAILNFFSYFTGVCAVLRVSLAYSLRYLHKGNLCYGVDTGFLGVDLHKSNNMGG